MTQLAFFRKVLAEPRDHVDQEKIGRRVIYAESDGREQMPGRFTRWQQAADRILRQHGRKTA
jgi:hypothetical protein